jgi:hypothetical protein
MASVAPAIAVTKNANAKAEPEVYDRVLSPELRAALDRGKKSAQTEPLVYLNFDEFPDDEE